MFIETLGQQIAVCSFDGAERLVKADKNYWNVVSICGPSDHKARSAWTKSIHYACFDDIEDPCSAIYHSPRAADIADIFNFIRSLGTGSARAPLLIHCAQGISRSTAVALSWIYGQLPTSEDRLEKAIDILLELRPQAKPNRLVLSLGLAQFLTVREACELAESMVAEPRLLRNRYQGSLEF